MRAKRNPSLIIAFLAIELCFYGIILTTGGKLRIWSEFISIICCFAFALLHFSKPLMICGLALTVCADFCLVVCEPIERLWGMVFFLGAQTAYAVMLHRQSLHKVLGAVRVCISIAIEVVTVLVLREHTDALALVSMLYYVNLIMNMVCAFVRFREDRMMAIGFVLFILCDTVIGLQTAAGTYLPIPEDSLVHNIIFTDFHLSWFFYLPSQVLLALSSRKRI